MGTLSAQTLFGDRYRILSLLGHGGMGNVYHAEHVTLGKRVALKLLGKAEGDLMVRFEREAKAIARLDHPGCVRILDYGHSPDGRQYIAMELVDGITLGSRLAKGPRLSTLRAVQIARGLLAGLAHAHNQGVIHRDVKPENVMLVGSRTVLIDFGLACVRDAPVVTAAGMCLGSPSYIAPERLLGHGYDARTDVYAVGVILYEMLAGVRPFAGDSPEAIMRRALERPARPLRAIRGDLPRALDLVVGRALAKDPARRFPDAEAMLSALADIEIEDTAVTHAVTERVEPEDQESTVAQIVLRAPSRWFRMWSWLRYGSWRWRPS